MLCEADGHFIGVRHLPLQGLRELFYKVWAVEHVIHKGASDPRYIRHLASALVIPEVHAINGFLGSRDVLLKEACGAAARRLGAKIICDPPSSLCEILEHQTVHAVLVRVSSREQYVGEHLLRYAKSFGSKTRLVCFREDDFVYLRFAIGALKVSRAHLLMPGGEWFLRTNQAWMYEMIATAILLCILRPDFCPTPSITFP